MPVTKAAKLIPGLLLIMTNLLLSCSSAPKTDENETASQAKAGETLTLVTTAVAENKKFEYLIHSNGKVKASREQVIIAESPGRLVTCRAAVGKRVGKGDLILRFDTTVTLYKLQKAALKLFESEREYQSQLLGYENMLQSKSPESASDIKQKLRISSGLAVAEQEVKEAEYELSKSTVEAPFSGVLADVTVQEGQHVSAGDKLFRIYDPANLLLEVKVLESDIAMLEIGMPAGVSTLSAPEVIYQASVSEINPYIDENGLVLVRLKIGVPARSPAIFPGMNCSAVIRIPSTKSLVVPKEAVVMRTGRAVVFTKENGKAKWNYVVTGRDNGKEIEIKEGLKTGQAVIVTNNLQLAHDAPVKDKTADL